jgi:hypothetical protein
MASKKTKRQSLKKPRKQKGDDAPSQMPPELADALKAIPPDQEAALAEAYHDMTTPEELHPDLQPYLDDSDRRFPIVHHHFFNGVITPGYCRRVNRIYLTIKEEYEEAAKQRDYRRMIDLVETPYKMEWLEKLAPEMSDADYWAALGVWYTEQEFFDQAQLRRLFAVDRPYREHLMDEEDRAALAQLPETFEVHRGYGKTANGWSWTIDRDKAIWFAQRFAGVSSDKPPMLATGSVDRSAVVAYFGGRGESEIVVDPKKVKRVTKTELKPQKRV